ncbi:unnamed protein product [Cladocopium goreaui]|uniref:Ankyrin-2 n=1 Tax=Cladocopium goreaui TaxID=2562237 RepID=A0A9P1GM34_9DINO|nr:unnamed protein product [Cladocopium goreaui]
MWQAARQVRTVLLSFSLCFLFLVNGGGRKLHHRLPLKWSCQALAGADCCWPSAGGTCSDNTQQQLTHGEFCCGYSPCDVTCCDCGRAGCRTTDPHKDCSEDLESLIAHCRSRPVFDEQINASSGFQDYNCTARVALPWGWIDQWLSFTNTVDITGISLNDDQVPDFDLWYSTDVDGEEWKRSGFYRGSVGFRRLSVGLLPSVRHLRLRWVWPKNWEILQQEARLPSPILFGCKHGEEPEAGLLKRMQSSFAAANSLRFITLVLTGCFLCVVVRSARRFGSWRRGAASPEAAGLVPFSGPDETSMEMTEGPPWVTRNRCVANIILTHTHTHTP